MTYWANVTEVGGRPRNRAVASRWPSAALALVGFLAVAGCASAQAPSEDPVAAAAKLLKQRTDLPAAPDFIQKSRPAAATPFVPVGAPRAEPDGKPLNRDQIKAEEARLEALLARNGKSKDRKPGRSAAGDPYVAPVKKKPAACVLTCEIK